jgi:dTDP-4-dehydrorhamnose reductase
MVYTKDMKKILLIGASSYLGARLYVDLSKTFHVVGTYASHKLSDAFIPLNITKDQEIRKVIQEVKPDIIVHAANNASAKWCNAHPAEAVAVNQTSMQYIADAANAANATLIYISSFSANDLSNMYGKTKHGSENIVKQSVKKYCIVRPSLILGYSPNTTNDRPFNRVLKNLDEGTLAVYDTSWKFQPTYIRHISEVIQQVIEKNILAKTLHVGVSDIKSRFDVAKDILAPFGVTVTPTDSNDPGVLLTDNYNTLRDLGLPEYTYEDMIREIVEEMNHRERFIIT